MVTLIELDSQMALDAWLAEHGSSVKVIKVYMVEDSRGPRPLTRGKVFVVIYERIGGRDRRVHGALDP